MRVGRVGYVGPFCYARLLDGVTSSKIHREKTMVSGSKAGGLSLPVLAKSALIARAHKTAYTAYMAYVCANLLETLGNFVGRL
ncbi:hypothetical protein FHS20_003229 [Phyllobacterium endophyticum]|nr:hypothetical protein [Phyllobacterium endophyticum]